MAHLIYNTAVWFYILFLKIAALFNAKAREFIRGRENWKENLSRIITKKDSWVWVHCASLGEFEQGRPLIEAIRRKYPHYKILLSFFSPSGYRVRSNYEHADAVVYLPADTPSHAAYFVSQVKPVLAVFVKYEFWYNHIRQLGLNHCTAILVSAAFRKEQLFFKWYGGLFRKMLKNFDALFVQDDRSAELLKGIGMAENVLVTGDTRYDRVAEIAANIQRNEVVEKFLGGAKAFIAGSTWETDEKLIHRCQSAFPDGWKIIIAPHELQPGRLNFIRNLFDGEPVFYSQLKSGADFTGKKILVVDNVGMLSGLYAYGSLAYVGGGFQKGGIHNVLEPAIFGLPVIFGPNYKKFTEARELKESGFAFPVSGGAECKQVLNQLIGDEPKSLRLKESVRQFTRKKTGATAAILQYVEQNDWL